MSRPRRGIEPPAPETEAAGDAGSDPPASRSPQAIDAVLFILLILTVAALLRITFHRVLYADEIEHAHVTWALAQGILPYRDIHQIHLPLLWMSVSPIFSRLPETVGSLLFLRTLCLVAFAGACWAGVVSLREFVESPTRSQVLCVVLVAVGLVVLSEYYRYRPDPFMSMFVAWSMVAVLRLRKNPTRYSFLAGVGLGLAACYSTKMVTMCLMVPLLCLVEAIRVRDWRPLLIALPNLAGFVVAVLPVALWLVGHGILPDFIEWTILHNFEMVGISISTFDYLVSVTPQLRVFAALALVSAVFVLWQLLRRPSEAWSPRAGLLIAIVLAWAVRAIEANHYDYNIQLMVIPVAVAASLALRGLLEVENRVVAMMVLTGALLVFLYRPIIVEGVRMRLVGVGVKGGALKAMIRRTRQPGATCVGFAPFHPVFCRDAGPLYLSWDFWFLKQKWMTPAGKAVYREMWTDALKVMHETKPTLIVDSRLWWHAKKANVITEEEFTRFQGLLRADYKPLNLFSFTAWLRKSPAGAQMHRPPTPNGGESRAKPTLPEVAAPPEEDSSP